jgi:threonine dehydratase
VLSLAPEQLTRGLVACSAGNHGQGVALAGQLAGARVQVYVPESTPAVKVDKMRALGAEVVLVPGLYGGAEAAAIRAAQEQGKVYVSPYNDPHVMAGAGTTALEFLEQAPDLTALFIPVGGGGLISGAGSAARALKPGIEIYGLQGENSAFMYAEYYTGDSSTVPDLPTLTDGLAGSIEPGSATLALTRELAQAIILLSEAEIERGIAYAYHRHGQVIEGSGAVGLAAVLAGKAPASPVPGLLVTGGNINPERHAEIVARWPAK